MRPGKDLRSFMSSNGAFGQLLQEVDFVLAQRRHFRVRGPHFIVTHIEHVPDTKCLPGERVGDVALAWSPAPLSLGLSETSMILWDCLLRYRMPLSARRIEEIMSTDPFYVDYAANRIGRGQVTALPDRRTVRVYVPRIWKQIERVFGDLGICRDPRQVLVSETTDTNVLVYRLRATSELVHIDQH
jgi:hypothetical protein